MYGPYKDGKFLAIPDWCLEDCPIPSENLIEKIESGYLTSVDPEDYRYLRRERYYVCNWIHSIGNIPILEGEFLSKLTWSEGKRFVRTCKASPKDVSNCIFKKPKDAIIALKKSCRTRDSHNHFLVRKVVDIDIEARCFYHKHKLRAVSIYQYLDDEQFEDFKSKIEEFFSKYKIPYNSAVIEVCIVKGEENIRLIEFNSFGIGQFSGASEFDWLNDKDVLYESQRTVYRMKNEFDF